MNVLKLVQELEDRLFFFYFLIEPRDGALRKVKVLWYADGIDLMVENREGLKALSEKSLTEVSQGKAHSQ